MNCTTSVILLVCFAQLGMLLSSENGNLKSDSSSRSNSNAAGAGAGLIVGLAPGEAGVTPELCNAPS
jgi:hypothetical protein